MRTWYRIRYPTEPICATRRDPKRLSRTERVCPAPAPSPCSPESCAFESQPGSQEIPAKWTETPRAPPRGALASHPIFVPLDTPRPRTAWPGTPPAQGGRSAHMIVARRTRGGRRAGARREAPKHAHLHWTRAQHGSILCENVPCGRVRRDRRAHPSLASRARGARLASRSGAVRRGRAPPRGGPACRLLPRRARRGMGASGATGHLTVVGRLSVRSSAAGAPVRVVPGVVWTRPGLSGNSCGHADRC